jgi:hypothetical protein
MENSNKYVRSIASFAVIALTAPVYAADIKWADWVSGNPGAGTASGQILTTTSTVTVDYVKPQGFYSFLQNGVAGDLTDYFQNNRSGRNPATSPYTSAAVDNIPTAAEMVALRQAGIQTLSFSETIANPYFAYVSLNGNGYAFDQDFEILSVGGVDGNDCGFWGCGTSSKNVVDLGNGNFEYQLVGTGEPHGVLRFLGAFDTVTWRSLSNENWNGFTVGIEGTEQEILLGDIVGVKFEDLNKNGIRDSGEQGLPGWEILLFDDAGNVVGQALTDASGSYSFVDLTLGDYTVEEVLQTGWTQTVGNGTYTVVGGQSLAVDFGNYQAGSPPPSGVPLPGTLLLLGVGLLGLRLRGNR